MLHIFMVFIEYDKWSVIAEGIDAYTHTHTHTHTHARAHTHTHARAQIQASVCLLVSKGS